VHDELERLCVHLVDQPLEALDLSGGVGYVAEDAEGDVARGERRQRRAAREKKERQMPREQQEC